MEKAKKVEPLADVVEELKSSLASMAKQQEKLEVELEDLRRKFSS